MQKDIMKACSYRQYGSYDKLDFITLPKPQPKPKEVLVRITMTSINAADSLLLQGKPAVLRCSQGFFRPKKHKQVLGSDLVGEVVGCGTKATKFSVGERVYGDLSDYKRGTFAEYICVSEEVILKLPDDVSDEHAASLPLAASTALQALREKGRVCSKQNVLIIGASGGVGNFAIQLVCHVGAFPTALCSARNSDIATLSGARTVIDYVKTDIRNDVSLYGIFNCILDTRGSYTMEELEPLLAAKGMYILVGGSIRSLGRVMFSGKRYSKKTKKTFTTYLQKANKQDLGWLIELLQKGVLHPHIDAVYPLAQIREAFRYYSEEHAQGKILISCT